MHKGAVPVQGQRCEGRFDFEVMSAYCEKGGHAKVVRQLKVMSTLAEFTVLSRGKSFAR